MKKPTERTGRFPCAAEQGRLDVARLLLAGGADVRARGHSGETGLHSAAGDGQTEMVSYLLPLIGELDVPAQLFLDRILGRRLGQAQDHSVDGSRSVPAVRIVTVVF